MLNLAELEPGEVLFLPAGNIHAYLEGRGIELMAASDNVLRGGLTPKHVDVPELLSVVDFTPGPVPYLEATELSSTAEAFRPSVPDFQLVRASGDATVVLAGDTIVLCTVGSFTIAGNTIERGAAAYVSADESPLAVSGSGELFIATSQSSVR
jgi:mannose-6-phosphate isomerase